jgi:trehalose/maltose hydrolase-like predicted phosphorylase
MISRSKCRPANSPSKLTNPAIVPPCLNRAVTECHSKISLHQSPDGYDALRESSVESRFAISNGFLGIRGGRSVTRGARWVVPARTYVAGMFDTPGTGSAAPGLVPAADWLRVRFMLAGGPMVHHPGDVSSHRTTLDLKRGALLSSARWSKACLITHLAQPTNRVLESLK